MQRINECPCCGGRAELEISVKGMSKGNISVSNEAALEVDLHIACGECACKFEHTCLLQLNELSVPQFDDFIGGWNKRVNVN